MGVMKQTALQIVQAHNPPVETKILPIHQLGDPYHDGTLSLNILSEQRKTKLFKPKTFSQN
jgi:hypothetical protein